MEPKEFDLENYSDIRKSMYIEASAGTGKTYNITGIVKKLVDQNIPLEKILIVTYTEKAAGELRNRIREKCPNKNVDNAPIYTIHSFCQNTLSEFAFTANQCSNLSLVSDLDFEGFLDRWIRDVLSKNQTFQELFSAANNQDSFITSLKKDFKQALSNYYLNTAGKEVPEIISMDEIYLIKNDNNYTFEYCDKLIEQAEIDYDSVRKEYKAIFSEKGCKTNFDKISNYNKLRFYISQLKSLYLAWQHEKEKNKSQTYDDMLRSVREAVSLPDSELKKQLQKKYTYAIIDEFQDTNQKQWDIFKTVFMEDDEHTIIVVGDPKQSIYAFQGADVNVYKNAVDLIEKNGGAAYRLSTNYRSTTSMVEACNLLFEDFFSKEPGISFNASKSSGKKAEALYKGNITKPLWIAGTPEKPVTESDFAKIAVQTIIDCCTFEKGKTKLQVLGRDVSFRDFAVLVRASTEYPEIEKALKKAGVPFLRYKDANLFAGRECAQWISLFNAIIAKDFTGRKRTILSEALFTDFFCIPLEEIENEIYDNPACPQRQLIIQWQLLAEQRKWAKLLEKIFADTDIENRLSKLDQLQAIAKIRQIGNYAVDYLYKNDSSLEDVCRHLLRLSNYAETSSDDSNIVEKGTEFDCVQLMTIHASKGLEFPVVIVPAGLKAKNNQKPRAYLYHNADKQAKLSFTDYGKTLYELEEDYERERLYYVAYTRSSSLMLLPYYDIWDESVSKQKAAPHKFLRKNIGTLFDGQGKEYVNEIKDNNKKYSELQEDVKNIILELDKKKESTATQSSDADESELAQLEETKKLSCSIPSLVLHKHSYSSLSHKKPVTEEMTENGGRADKEESSWEQVSLSDFDRSDNPVIITARPDSKTFINEVPDAPFNFPKGRKLGIALHEVFEKADFEKIGKLTDLNTAEKDEDIRRLITACFEKQTLIIPEEDPDKWLTYTTSILWNTLNATLPEISGSKQTSRYFSLKEINTADKISEAEFNMNADISPDKKEILTNYCNGFIDLVFKRNVDGKDLYSILDWKSDTFEDNLYADETRLKQHTDDRYSIQRVLYSYSLIKWLASFYKDKSEDEIFENHFGGIYYAYVRGCQKDTCSGIFARTWKSWQELENAFEEIKTW